ncbi:uncharacterized protein LOC110035667 [Phalaenopsis equestris]|uniref:uncharacterized protein LOC110035667 n=1 Tax=Phalaenopsis equestris TaxID=78828 RepID=UPI0009E5EE58|nr:uncharacterized protein LOC110035667 [Phalaenopsis equestris]
MSPASKSKSKNKSTPKAGKEQLRISPKPSAAHWSSCNSSLAGSTDPVMGTFQALEMSSSSFPPSQSNGRFGTIDDLDDHSGSSLSSTAEYDSSSNNGSCSGESEDQKEKLANSPPQTETIPGSNPNKQGKIRQTNERKHRRQKERRALELHERCISFLTSRKLEALSHLLVSMGFPSDRATMAVIVNEGKMEESVAWLLQDGDGNNKQQVSLNLEDKTSVKIDITDELTRIVEMEVRHKCSRQDVERAIVACEGDLFKADENLKVSKRTVSAATVLNSDQSADSMELNHKDSAPHNSAILLRSPIKEITQQLKESANRNHQQAPKRISPKLMAITDSSRTQAASVDKRRSTTSTPVSLSSPIQAFGSAAKLHAVKEPFIVMQRPKQKLPSTSASANSGTGKSGVTVQQSYPQNNLQQIPSVPVELLASAGWSSGRSQNAPSPFATPSSLGLYTGWGSSPSSESSQNDWNSFAPLRDYTLIDWSLNPMPRKPSMKIDVVSNTWSTMFMGGSSMNGGGGGGVYLPALHQVRSRLSDYSAPTGSEEWTSPFCGRDLFMVPRQYVTSPSM